MYHAGAEVCLRDNASSTQTYRVKFGGKCQLIDSPTFVKRGQTQTESLWTECAHDWDGLAADREYRRRSAA